jgi:hypothetical protein
MAPLGIARAARVLRKLMIGPALTGIGYLAGAYYGADAEQIVHKSPDATYQGVSDWIDALGPSGTTSFEGGKPTPYQIEVDRTQDKHLTVHILFDGHEGGLADLDFTPQGDGETTLVKAKAHGDTRVLSSALAGTAMARMAYAPDWMLNIFTLRPLMNTVAGEIEQGQPSAPDIEESEAQREASLPPDQQQKLQQWQQYDATRPTTDPDADARRYMNGEG